MNAIHLIQKETKLLPKPVTLGSQTYESGFWALPIKQAESLIGGNIFFHKKQKSPSFFGGVINGYRVQQDGEWEGRVIFKFEASISHKGRYPQHLSGWSMEMKLEE